MARSLAFVVGGMGIALLGQVAGCSPEIVAGKFACDAERGCPSGWFCRNDNRCYPTPGDADGGVDSGVDAGPSCPVSCDDGNECTDDICDASSHTCVSVPKKDGSNCGDDEEELCCDGECVDTESDDDACGASCTACSANEECDDSECDCVEPWEDCDSVPGCETNLESDPDHCGACGIECASGKSCIVVNGTPTCTGCKDSDDCDDGLECTTDTCDGTECKARLQDDHCVIEGVCYEDGMPNPDNECEVCNADEDPEHWSGNDGAECDDGDGCTQNDRCKNRSCEAGPARQCEDDGVACNGVPVCTEGVCRPTNPRCPLWNETPGQNCAVKDLAFGCVPCGRRGGPCCVPYGRSRRSECDEGLTCRGVTIGGTTRTCLN